MCNLTFITFFCVLQKKEKLSCISLPNRPIFLALVFIFSSEMESEKAIY